MATAAAIRAVWADHAGAFAHASALNDEYEGTSLCERTKAWTLSLCERTEAESRVAATGAGSTK